MTVSLRFLRSGLLIILCVSGPTQLASAGETDDATITKRFGSVKILTNPSKSPEKIAPPRALFEGLYYSEVKANEGDVVKIGDIVQTGKGARARMIFNNGDQLTVSADTSYRLSKSGDKSTLDLFMGSMRSTIDKEGPRNEMKIRARTSVMGIRGTDFLVSAYGEGGRSEVAVFRGAVEAAPINELNKKYTVNAGFSAAIPAKVETKGKSNDKAATGGNKDVVEDVIVKEMSKEYLIAANEMTSLPPTVMVASVGKDKKPDPKQLKLNELESKAIAATLRDIKTHDPALYEKVSGKNLQDIEQLKNFTNQRLLEEAKSEAVTDKTLKSKEKNKNRDVYDEYYDK